jgi:hypothetical protein
MEYLLGALAVYWIWTLIETYLTAPQWGWYLIVTAQSLLLQTIFIDAEEWQWGLAIAGLANLFHLVSDLLLVTSDRVRVEVLRRTGR